jgi:hypothetical protein
VSHYVWLPLIAFASMFCQDVLAVWLVRAESTGRAHAAARWDVLGDAARLAGLSVNTDAILLSHNLLLTVLTVAATFCADYWGSWTGVKLGVHLDSRREAVRAAAVLSATRQLGSRCEDPRVA